MKKATRFTSRTILVMVLCGLLSKSYGQDLSYAKTITALLSSSRMHGRGYVKNGDFLAATLIRKEFQRIGLIPFNEDYYQYFGLCVNTFPGAMRLEINEKELVPGFDYMIDPASGKCKGRFEVYSVPVHILALDSADKEISAAAGKILIIDSRKLNELKKTDLAKIDMFRRKLLTGNSVKINGVVELTLDKLWYGISSVAYSLPYFRVNAACCSDTIASVSIKVKNEFLDNYKTRNVAGFIRGTSNPDSMLVFTAHYDHLGTMGKKTFFPGANDNASGIAMLLVLAEHFIKNPPRFTVVFLAFSGEELGLLGSQYFVQNPMVDLRSVKFLVNLDLVGNGDEGITVVNGSIYQDYFNKLTAINDEAKLLPKIKQRGESCNSDHCPFYRKGVPSFYIYAMGGTKAYHDPGDRMESLTYSGFNGLTKLLIGFSEGF